jgi:hypothetical protein
MLCRVGLSLVLVVAGLTAAGAQQPALKSAAKPPVNPMVEAAKNPLLLYVARGEDGACGPGCSEWIAVEGNFDLNAGSRFRDFIASFGKRKLPLFFHSPGGSVQQAQAIGRLMRERGMIAGVARTVPEACTGKDNAPCESAKKSGKELRAEWTAINASCSSACVYALIGARERLVPLGSRLAVHSSRTTCLTKGVIADPKLPWCQNLQIANKAETLKYVRQLGIDAALVEVAFDTPHETLRTLTREEIDRFGIDRAKPRESPWMVNRTSSGVNMVRLVEIKGTDEKPHFGAIQMGCYPTGRLNVVHFWPDDQQKISVAAVIDGRRYEFTSRVYSSSFDVLGKWLERRELWVPLDQVAPSRLVIEVRALNQPRDAPPIAVHQPADGFAHAWKQVLPSCELRRN